MHNFCWFIRPYLQKVKEVPLIIWLTWITLARVTGKELWIDAGMSETLNVGV